MKNDILVSIFIPIYNGEKYLEDTLLSIKNQSYSNLEVILVDNASTDRTKEIISKFTKDDNKFISIFNDKVNSVANTWNKILPILKGNFVFYSSQDDLFSEDLLAKMVERVILTKADIVLPDMEYYYENIKNNKRIIGLNLNREIILTGREAFLETLNWNIHGFALIRKNLFENEVFPEDAFDSDEFVTRKLFFKSNKVVFSEGVFFYRQDNQNAVTKKVDVNVFYTLNTLLKLYLFIEENKFDKKLVLKFQFKLQREYLYYLALFKIFAFSDKDEFLKVKNYLENFRTQNLMRFSLSSENSYLKLNILNIIFKSSFLFKICLKIQILKLKTKI